jgi:hypothetical protein
MTNQEVLDIAAPFIYRQGQRSTNENKGCVYRSADGLKCPIGACIPDEDYNKAFDEGDSCISTMIRTNDYFAVKFSGCNRDFLTELQELHDNIEGNECRFRTKWRNGVTDLAQAYALKVPTMEL